MLELALDLFKLVNIAVQPAKPAADSTLLPPPPPGMSRNQLYRIVGKEGSTCELNSADKIVQVKLGVISFLTEFQLFNHEVLPHLFVAHGDGNHKVADKAESALKRRLGKGELNEQPVVNILYDLYLGTWDAPGQPKTLPDDRRSIASVRLRPLLLTQMCRSTIASSTMPAAMLTVINAVFGKDITARIRMLGSVGYHLRSFPSSMQTSCD